MSEVIALVVAPIIGLVGVYIGYWLNSRREDRALRRELSLEHYRAGQRLFDDVVTSAGRRFVALQGWLWAIDAPDASAGTSARDDYFTLVPEWNAAIWSRRARLYIMLGQAVANSFVDYADDFRPEPESLHYMFVAAHSAVLAPRT